MMNVSPSVFGYESMGTTWKVSIWDVIDAAVLKDIGASIRAQSQAFDETYSRFKKSSLIWSLAKKSGVVEVPHDLISMLRLYEQLFDATDGACTPLLGFALSDLGYDSEYSLQEQVTIRPVPNFHDALTIVDDTHLDLHQSVLLDLGALGKGFFVDKLSIFLTKKGIRRFLVNGSGDIYYHGKETIRAGLEDPEDEAKAIGVLPMQTGALCASAGNRRAWGKHTHILNPKTLESPKDILAVWVLAENAALADGLATCLFFVAPESLREQFSFEYCILNRERRVKKSEGFAAELF